MDSEESLICRVVNRLCSVPLDHVIETMRPLPVTPVNGVPRPVMGVAVIRGAAMPVVDLAWILGADESQPTRFVTVSAEGRRVALAVDRVVGVRVIPASSLQELPSMLRDVRTDAVATIATLDAELLMVLRSGRLIPESVWDALEADGLFT